MKDKIKLKFSVNGVNVATRNKDGEWTLLKDKDPDPVKPMEEKEATNKASFFNSGLKSILNFVFGKNNNNQN
jgi:hypothetical protein